MGIERYRNDNPRDASEVADAIETTLQSLAPPNTTYPTGQGTHHYALIQSLARTIAQQQEVELNELYDSAFLTDATGEELTKKAREVGVIRRDPVTATGVIKFQRESAATQDYTIPAGTIVGTGGDDSVRFETQDTVTLSNGDTSVQADIEALTPGPDGNVGQGQIDVLVSGSVSGVTTVTNPQPTGDPSFTLTNGQTAQRPGSQGETDEQLRDRALDSTAVGGAGTAQAVELALLNLPEVQNVDVFTNRSGSVTNNVDPWHTEVRILGGEVVDIADTLYETLPITTLKTLQGGANGTKEAVTFDRSELYGPIEVSITRPTVTTANVSANVILTDNDNYGGNQAVEEAIISYIGGTLPDGTTARGRGQGEVIYMNEIENAIEDVTGVRFANINSVDVDGDNTSEITESPYGIDVYETGPAEIVVTNSDNVSLSTSIESL